MKKYCSLVQKSEGRESAKILRSLEQFTQTKKGQNNFETEYFFNLSLDGGF